MRRWLGILAGCLAGFGQAVAQPGPVWELPSCVAGSPPMTLAANATLARLDSSDRARFHAAAQARYPLYRRGGFVPADVVLLQRGSQWLYVATWPRGAGLSCFTAVFAADSFDFTRRWLEKYQPRAREVGDD